MQLSFPKKELFNLIPDYDQAGYLASLAQKFVQFMKNRERKISKVIYLKYWHT